MYKEYLTNEKSKPKKSKIKMILKLVKLTIFSFLIISMLWGCSEMFVSKYTSYQIVDSSGASVYKSGVFFEILFYSFSSGKIHYFHMLGTGFYEYPYLSISSWKEAFTETQSPFYGCFVYPTALILVSLISLFGGMLNGAAIIFAIFIMSLLVRAITVGFTWKTQMNQAKMQVLQLKQTEIKNKYKNNKDPAAKKMQQMEIMQLYKKNKMNPLASLGTTFLSFPFLFALYITIKSTRVLKSATIGDISLIQKPWSMITSGDFIYLSLLAVYLPMQIMSVFLPTFLNLKTEKSKTPEQKKARRKQYIMQGVFVIVFVFVAVSVAAGVVIYWIFSGFLQIMQTVLFHYAKIWDSKKHKRRKAKDKRKADVINAKFKEIYASKIIVKDKSKSNRKKDSKKPDAKSKSKTFKL